MQMESTLQFPGIVKDKNIYLMINLIIFNLNGKIFFIWSKNVS